MHVNAKMEFKLRSLKNWAWCIGGFVLLAVYAAMILPSPFRWLVDIAGIAVAYYVLFFVLEKRAIGIRCPGCLKYIATNTPWVCGFCKAENRRPDDFPFVHQCEHCSAQPKAYKCHHNQGDRPCGKIIFLSPDEQEQNYAYCLNTETQPLPEDNIVREVKSCKSVFALLGAHQSLAAEFML